MLSLLLSFFFFNDTATTEIYTLSLHDALPIFALAAEKLMGIEITPRCKVLRVMACEMSRIISHMVWLGTTSIDLGAFTPFLWAFQERERIYNLQEMWTGARLTTSVTRVGGLMADVPDDFVAGLREFTQTF